MSDGAKLVAVAGPLKGTAYELPESPLVIGRDLSSDVCIRDQALSRHHCRVLLQEGLYYVEDLGSRNGTTVNDAPAQRQALRDGDRIQVGGSLLLFVNSEWPRHADAWLDGGTLLTKASARVSLEDALYALARDMSALLKIGAQINAIRSSSALYQKLIESAFALIPAERGALILLAEQSTREPVAAHVLDQSAGGGRMQISRTVIGQVLKEGVSVMSNDLTGGGALSGAESLMGGRVRSLMCAPLSLLGRVIGLIYLDASEDAAEFDEGHLNILTALAGFAAGAVEATRRLERLEGENQRLLSDLQLEQKLIGEGLRTREVLKVIAKVAPTDSNVFIRGESGTGKELAARAIHRQSLRANRPFVAVNCAALTESLLESEFFGHEKGAFTGAVAQKKGKIEAADTGTLFLDEVGELAPHLQSKLLRVLQEREFERVGGTRPVRVDIRVVAATNKNLEEAIAAGGFRSDLYHRLNVITLKMPPLRERREDIPALAEHFIAKYSQRCKRRVKGLSPEALERLVCYDWPGNVRELENAIERAVVMGSTECVMAEDLPEQVLEVAPAAGAAPSGYAARLKEAKRAIVLDALEHSQGNYTRAAKLLAIHPNNLHRLMRNLGLKSPDSPRSSDD